MFLKMNMKMIHVLLVMYELIVIGSAYQQCNIICDDDHLQSSTPSPPVAGLPGKAGPKGARGNIGPLGETGEKGEAAESCECPSLDGMREEMTSMKEELTNKINGVDYIMQRLLSMNDNRIKLCGNLRSPSKIEDSQLTASSSWITDDNSHDPSHGRLFSTSGRGGWHVGQNMRDYEWIQVDLEQNEELYGVATQGRYNSNQWVTSYSVLYKTDGGGSFLNIVDKSGEPVVFQGNTDHSTVVIQNFPQPIRARYLLIHPLVASSVSWIGALSLRFDVLTC